MNTNQSAPESTSNSIDIQSDDQSQEFQPEAGTRDLEEESIRQSSPLSDRMEEKQQQAPEEA